ncbi:MAG: hypothetical protein H0U74_00590 [Bradymonadaceae bacterium]|nr:hypothetical protein [Lujinxingiaceae bacterium]
MACRPLRAPDLAATIHAVSDDDIYIQLIWATPDVPEPTQGLGTDVDLHYLHPLGRWNRAPYDDVERQVTG